MAQVMITIPEQVYTNLIGDKNITLSKTISKEPTSKIVLAGEIIEFIFCVIASIIPAFQYRIGEGFSDKCPLDWHIPRYLLIAGMVGLACVALGMIQDVLKIQFLRNCTEETPKFKHTPFSLSISYLKSVLIFFLFIWYIFGCFWIFRSWNIVQYDYHPNETDYCHPFLYRFTYYYFCYAALYYTVYYGGKYLIKLKN